MTISKVTFSTALSAFTVLITQPTTTFASSSFSKLQKIDADTHVLSQKKSKGGEFNLQSEQESAEQTVTKFQYYQNGIEVIGAMALSITDKYSGTSESRHTVSDFDIALSPTLSRDEAVNLTQNTFKNTGFAGEPKLKILPDSDQRTASLIYEVPHTETIEALTSTSSVLLDAQSGRVIAVLPGEYTIAPVQVFDASSAPASAVDTKGNPISFNFPMKRTVKDSVAARSADSTSLNALQNAQKVLSYYSSTHARNSFDNQGSSVVNYIKAGKDWKNAFWSSTMKIMAYGAGDGKVFGDFSNAVDVSAHELTHGVISSTANLMYVAESGALNEAIADSFGKMVENQNDWSIGKNVFIDSAAHPNGLRNLADPNSVKLQFQGKDGKPVLYSQPATMAQKFNDKLPTCDHTNDYCWVHINATIFGHAFYLMYQRTGKAVAEKLLYNALLQLTPTSKFRDAAAAILLVCSKTQTASTCNGIKSDFQSLGINTTAGASAFYAREAGSNFLIDSMM